MTPWLRAGDRSAEPGRGPPPRVRMLALRACWPRRNHLWQPGQPKRTVEWQRGACSPPINCFYQHFNLDGQQPGAAVWRDQCPNADEHLSRARVPLQQYVCVPRPLRCRGGLLHARGPAGQPQIRGPRITSPIFGLSGSTGPPIEAAGYGRSSCSRTTRWQCTVVSSRQAPTRRPIATTWGPTSSFWMAKASRSCGSRRAATARRLEGQERAVAAGDRIPSALQHRRPGSLPGHATRPARRAILWGLRPVQIEYEDEDPAIYALYEQECAKHGARVVLPRPVYRGNR